jgi:hypothetical protein
MKVESLHNKLENHHVVTRSTFFITLKNYPRSNSFTANKKNNKFCFLKKLIPIDFINLSTKVNHLLNPPYYLIIPAKMVARFFGRIL